MDIPGIGDMMQMHKAVNVQHVQDLEYEVQKLSAQIEEHEEPIGALRKRITRLHKPGTQGVFSEVPDFEGFNSLQFFHHSGMTLEHSLGSALKAIRSVRALANKNPLPEPEDITHAYLAQVHEREQVLTAIGSTSLEIVQKAMIRYDQIVATVYKRMLDQFKYLQKRFLNIGQDDARVYRAPWEEDDEHGYDFGRVPHVKIDLVEGNALLTDFLLDALANLPEYTRRWRTVKGKRRLQNHLNQFNLDRCARILLEVSDPQYQQYLRSPQLFVHEVAGILTDYGSVLSDLENAFRGFLEKSSARFLTDEDASLIEDTEPLVARIRNMDFNSIRPHPEDVRPSNSVERKYFSWRHKAMVHLLSAFNKLSKSRKFDAAVQAVQKGVKLRQKMRDARKTRTSQKMETDKAIGNEFYVGVTGQHGEFGFRREISPTVKMSEVIGKSFDTLKEHLEDLGSVYARHPELFTLTSPRGKVKSNLIAIGPYGCGKTEISRALASDSRFITAEVAVTDLLTCWFGEFEKNVDRVWDAASDLRVKSGDSKLVFLVMDEFDSWFRDPNEGTHDSAFTTVQKALQMKLDGVVDYPGIVALGFTNDPEQIPLAIYRRFKYVDVVGQLDQEERVKLLKQFLGNMPLSRGFRRQHYEAWATMLEGATGDVIGKAVDDVHYEFMREFISQNSQDSRKLERYIIDARRKGETIDVAHVKREIGRHMRLDPKSVESHLRIKLADPIIRQQIDAARKVYRDADRILSDLYGKNPRRAGFSPPDAMTARGHSLG